jgi:hypothetical protein
VLAFSASTSAPPAYAVTTNADGTVTVTLGDMSALVALNAELVRDGISHSCPPDRQLPAPRVPDHHASRNESGYIRGCRKLRCAAGRGDKVTTRWIVRTTIGRAERAWA